MEYFPILLLLGALFLLGGGVYFLVSSRWPGPGTTLADRVRLGRTELVYWAMFTSVIILNLDERGPGWQIESALLMVLTVLLLLVHLKLNRIERTGDKPDTVSDPR